MTKLILNLSNCSGLKITQKINKSLDYSKYNSYKNQMQWLIFNFKKLQFKNNIKCSADKTPLQRELYRNAYTQLKSREEKGEENLIVKYKNNIPTAMIKSTREITAHNAISTNKTTFHKQK